jgi:hypothetical protein
MGFLKNMTIKRVTKKRFNQLMGLIENDLPIGNDTPVDPMKTLMGYIEAVELGRETIEVPPDITHWWDFFVYLICIMVRSELAYDPTMGSERDLNLIIETANIELKKWKRESVLKKFARRNMIIGMGEKILIRS